MVKIVVSGNVTLDGTIQDQAGDEGFSRGGWTGSTGPRGRQATAKVPLDEALDANALLLGRRTDEFWARSGTPGLANSRTG